VVFADNEAIGTVRPNMFVHTTLEPGKHGILLRNDALASGTGGFETFEGHANDVIFYWVGVTGKGFGVLTVDHFLDKLPSIDVVAIPRRSTSSLGDLFALTGPARSETMLAWISTS
jgi:hypothetical protein